MEFFIKKNATLPLLKLQVVKDGRSDYNNFMELLETSTIFFSMVNSETGIPKITSRPGGFVEKIFDDPNAEPEYYIYYQFTKQDTSIEGRYEGQFLVKTYDGNVILPIREKLYIYVQESFIADDLTYNTCYTSTFPCCGNPNIVENPNENTITITSQYYPSSIGVLYTATSRYPVDTDITVTFKNVLGVTTGDPIIINSSVSIYTGSKEGITELIIDDDFNRLNLYTLFSDIILTDNGPSQYDNIVIIDGPVVIDPIPPRPRVKYLSANVTSCCDNTELCMTGIPSNIGAAVGVGLLGSDGLCYVINELGSFVCDSTVSFNTSYYKNCEWCLSKYPCNVIRETPTPTPTSTITQNPCFITPTPTPTFKKECVGPVLNTVLNSNGNTFLLYFTINGPCETILVNWSSDNVTWNNDAGGCSSPRSITIPGSLPPTLYFNITQFTIECPPFTSNTVTFNVIPVTPTPTGTPALTPTPTGTALPPISVCFVDCCDRSNIFMVYGVPSGSNYEGTYYIQSSGFNGCAVVTECYNRPSLVYSYIGLVKQIDCTSCFEKTQTFCNTPTPTPTNTVTPTHLVCDINYDVILVSQTPTQTPTPTVTPTQTSTPTLTPTKTIGLTQTPTNTPTQTQTQTKTPTPTPTQTKTQTPTPTQTPTHTSTPTPTLTPTQTHGAIVVPQCSVIYCDQPTGETGKVYFYDLTTNVSTLLFNPTPPQPDSSSDIAHTNNKLWLYSNQTIYEWNITLNPFTKVFNRTISTGIFLGNGLCAINDTQLICSNTVNPRNVVKITLNPNNTITSESLFNLPAGRDVSGDIIYTTNGKIIVTTYSTGVNYNSYISQYSLIGNTWVLEFDKQITTPTTSPYGLATINGGIYIFSVTSIYKIDTVFPYTIMSVNNIGKFLSGASQVPSCNNVTFNTSSSVDCAPCIFYQLPGGWGGSQDGNGSITVGNLVITTTYTGPSLFVGTRPSSVNIPCMQRTYDANTIFLGQNEGPYTYTINFNQQVNNIKLLMSGMGGFANPNTDEIFTFNTNIGAPTLKTCGAYCGVINITGNVLSSHWALNPNGDLIIGNNRYYSGNCILQIKGGAPYTQIVITGVGGVAGTSINICLDTQSS